MPFCIRCADPPCSDEGIISVNWNTRGTAKPIGGTCSTGNGGDEEYIPGPVNGSVTIQAYAFGKDDTDLWLGSKCVTQAQASQQNILKYNGKDDSYLIIPTSINSGSISGDPVKGLTLDSTCANTESVRMNLLAGSVTVTTLLGTDIGHGLNYTGAPYPMKFPNLNPYKVLGQEGCYQSGFSLNVDFPNSPAQVTYSWQFVVDC